MALRFLNQGGEMGRRIRECDWAGTPFGRIEDWPVPLRSALGICLASSFPTAIYWGPELRLLYNDAWSHIPAERHPGCLGQPAAEVWSDIWNVIAPQFEHVLESGDGFATYDQLLMMERNGASEETYWNYSFTPIRDENGDVVGVFNQGNETTREVLARQMSIAETERLRELFHQAPGALALLRGPDMIFEFANDAYGDLVGHRNIIGKPVAEALPEIAGSEFTDLLLEVRRSGKAYRADATAVPLFRREGGVSEVRLLDFVYQPIVNAHGEVADILVQANDVTDRARAEAELRKSEERLQLALDSSVGIGTWDWDVAADKVTADARFAKLYGVDPEVAAAGAPIGQFFDGIHPDDLPRVNAAIDVALRDGSMFIEEYRLPQPDGSLRWVAAQGRARLDEDGRATRFPGVSFDITQRREAEEAARAASSELRAATETQAFIFRLADRLRGETTPNAIMRATATAIGRRLTADRAGFYRVVDDHYQFGPSWTSDSLTPMHGTMPIAALGDAVLARYRVGSTVVIEDTARDLGEHLNRLAGAAVGVPLRRQGGWAATFYVNQSQPRRWTADEIAVIEAVAEIAWDAVDRAEAALALRESEAKFRAIANSIEVMVWSTLPDGFHDYYNDQWYEFTGVPVGTTDGAGWNNMFHPDDQDRAWATWRHSLATGEHYRIEYRLRHHSGQYRWVLGQAQPVRDEDDRIVRWFGTCTDIQDMVEAREVLARSRADLEAEVAQRTEQLMEAEAQLRQAQKMEAVGQLTGGIAHDFNNMLAVVIGALDLMERRLAKGDSNVARYVDAARDGAGRAAALTQRLLSFSRQTPLTPIAVDLNALVTGMIDLLTRTLGGMIVIETRLDAGVAHVTADPSQLENAILNLSVNARDAMPRGGRLVIATHSREIDERGAARLGIAPGDYVEVEVSDSGSGMPPEVAAKAFDPFFTTKSVGKGTGLGLSQVFGFVRQSGGHVALETAPGEGTTIRLLLPRETSEAPAPRVASKEGTPRGSSHERILVVEDDDRVRAFSAEALRDLGYTVLEAHNGPEALRLLQGAEHVGLLFTDVVMPEMTGRELADAAKVVLPGLRVLFTSGYTRDAVDHDDALAAAVLSKPFDVATLARRVNAALDG
jgi:PAS domain S-box-containing protein